MVTFFVLKGPSCWAKPYPGRLHPCLESVSHRRDFAMPIVEMSTQGLRPPPGLGVEPGTALLSANHCQVHSFEVPLQRALIRTPLQTHTRPLF